LETEQSPNFASLAVRLAGYGQRIFAEFGLGGRGGTVRGVGLSIEDFVGNVLSEYLEGRLAHEVSRGELFSLLATAMRNDIIDALRRAAHAREEARSPVRRECGAEGLPALVELPARAAEIAALIDEERYRKRVRGAFANEPELADVVKAVLDLDLSKPQEIAETLGISPDEVQNRKRGCAGGSWNTGWSQEEDNE
jgi:DNA-directed RNA polymerase specialized sigma24 family protein